MNLRTLFRRRPDPSDLAIRRTIKVMPRETLRTIAEREYGDQRQWSIIFERNKWRFDDQDPRLSILGWTSISPNLLRKTSSTVGAEGRDRTDTREYLTGF